MKGYSESENWKEWIAEKDFKTCAVCKTLRGKIYGINEPVFPEPPLHPHCRCKIEIIQVIGKSNSEADYYINAVIAFGRPKYDNTDGKLPDASWRIWYEANTVNIDGNIGAERILYSSDGLVFVTGDNYKMFVEIRGDYNNISDFPANVQNAYKAYEAHGWRTGQVPSLSMQGTKAGRAWDNDKNQLPTTDSSGNPITYREFDINNKVPGSRRDGERFVVGSDGSIYYTDSHYGEGQSLKNLPDFIKIK